MTAADNTRRDWLIFGLACGCLVFAALSVCLGIAVSRKYAPLVVTKEVIKEVEKIVEVPEAEPPKPLPIQLKATDLVQHMRDKCGLSPAENQSDFFTLLVEPRHRGRINVAIEPSGDGRINEAEVSILAKDVYAADPDAVEAFVFACGHFLNFFNVTNPNPHFKEIKHVIQQVQKGFRIDHREKLPLGTIVFERGPRDFQDAFILKIVPPLQ